MHHQTKYFLSLKSAYNGPREQISITKNFGFSQEAHASYPDMLILAMYCQIYFAIYFVPKLDGYSKVYIVPLTIYY